MARNNKIRAFKTFITWPGQRRSVHAFATFDAADILAGEVGANGAHTETVIRGTEGDTHLTEYGPDVTHTITELPEPSPVDAPWRCTCGAAALFESRTMPGYSLEEHLNRTGLETVVWKVMSAKTDGPGAEPGPLNITIPDYILAWAAGQGAAAENPDFYVLVTTPDQDPALEGEVASRRGALPEDEVEAIRAKIDEWGLAELPKRTR